METLFLTKIIILKCSTTLYSKYLVYTYPNPLLFVVRGGGGGGVEEMDPPNSLILVVVGGGLDGRQGIRLTVGGHSYPGPRPSPQILRSLSFFLSPSSSVVHFS